MVSVDGARQSGIAVGMLRLQTTVAFAPLVLGIRQYQNRNYADAVLLLCTGTQQLDSVLGGQAALGDTAFRARQQALMKKVKEITDAAIREAKKAPDSPYQVWTPSIDGTFACPQ